MKKSKSKGIRQKAISKSVERSSEQAPSETKQTRRTTTEAEKEILAQLFEDDNESLETRIDKVALQLGWDKSRVKQYLKNYNSRQKRTG